MLPIPTVEQMKDTDSGYNSPVEEMQLRGIVQEILQNSGGMESLPNVMDLIGSASDDDPFLIIHWIPRDTYVVDINANPLGQLFNMVAGDINPPQGAGGYTYKEFRHLIIKKCLTGIEADITNVGNHDCLFQCKNLTAYTEFEHINCIMDVDQLRQGFVMALAVVKNENEQLKERLEMLTKEKELLGNLVKQLQSQRNEITAKYNILEKDTCEKIKPLEKKIKELTALVDEKSDVKKQAELPKELVNAQRENETQRKLIDLLTELNDVRKELNDVQKKLIGVQRRENDVQKELASTQKKFSETAAELSNITKRSKLQTLRSALHTFERLKINVSDAKLRGKYWEEFFSTGKPKEILEEMEFKGNVKNTTLSLFLKVNASCHDAYNLEDEFEVPESTLAPDELTLIRALWKLSPLRKGKIKINED